jgi:hypothetical protein
MDSRILAHTRRRLDTGRSGPKTKFLSERYQPLTFLCGDHTINLERKLVTKTQIEITLGTAASPPQNHHREVSLNPWQQHRCSS